MHDYNHHKPQDGLGKIPPVKHAQLNLTQNLSQSLGDAQ